MLLLSLHLRAVICLRINYIAATHTRRRLQVYGNKRMEDNTHANIEPRKKNTYTCCVTTKTLTASGENAKTIKENILMIIGMLCRCCQYAARAKYQRVHKYLREVCTHLWGRSKNAVLTLSSPFYSFPFLRYVCILLLPSFHLFRPCALLLFGSICVYFFAFTKIRQR